MSAEQTPPPGQDATIAEGRAWLEGVMYDDGGECPCCTQYVKVYRRKISALAAAALIVMERTHGTGWCDLPAIVGGLSPRAKGGDEAKTRYWGLIEPQPGTLDASQHRGIWRLTALGVSFARGEVTVPKYALVYDGRCLDLTGEQVAIADALGERFDYNELMGRAS